MHFNNCILQTKGLNKMKNALLLSLVLVSIDQSTKMLSRNLIHNTDDYTQFFFLIEHNKPLDFLIVLIAITTLSTIFIKFWGTKTSQAALIVSVVSASHLAEQYITGSVTDYMNVEMITHFYIFNLADIFIIMYTLVTCAYLIEMQSNNLIHLK